MALFNRKWRVARSTKVPYGGLIYIKGNSSTNESASFTFTGVVKAPFYKDGAWKNDLNSPAPLGELESDAFVYTTPKKNLNASNSRQGSIRGASRMLNMSQPALSKSIQELEEGLAAQLFFRRSKGVTLTDAGESFYQHASLILEELRAAQEDIRQRQGQLAG